MGTTPSTSIRIGRQEIKGLVRISGRIFSSQLQYRAWDVKAGTGRCERLLRGPEVRRSRDDKGTQPLEQRARSHGNTEHHRPSDMFNEGGDEKQSTELLLL